MNLDRNLAVLRIGLAAAALGVLVLGWWLGRTGQARRWIRPRQVALALLAVLLLALVGWNHGGAAAEAQPTG